MCCITEAEVAEMLRCSRACLRRMRRENRGPRWIRVGRLIRYPEQWLREYIERNGSGVRAEVQAKAGKGDLADVSDETVNRGKQVSVKGAGRSDGNEHQ
jgi:hypothetical protein